MSSYDTLPYDDRPFYRTHPGVLGAIAVLHRLTPPPVERCRVLELGCAVGGNLIPMALGLPGARFVGIDLSARQIAMGQEVITALGLANVELRAMSILDVDERLGEFDYIVCHGVYSWVPAVVQDKILAICGRQLAANGIAYVSYNAYPGWHLRGMVRDIMRWHARQFDGPEQQLGQARAFIDFVARFQAARSRENTYGTLLKEEAAQLGAEPDDYLFHEHLEDHNQPLYFHEFAARSAAHGLTYVDDAKPSDPLANLPAELGATLHGIATDAISYEQYLDFLVGRVFRRSLLCRASQAPVPERRPEALETLLVSAHVEPVSSAPDLDSPAVEQFRARDREVTISTNAPALKAALVHLAASWPRALPFAALADHTSPSPDPARELAGSLLRCYLDDLVELRTHQPACAVEPGERPAASPFARVQAVRQPRVTNLLHRAVELPDLERLLLRQLDGRRDRPALVEVLTEAVTSGAFRLEKDGQPQHDRAAARAVFAAWLEPALARLANAALLVA
jgi:methyltransferase-like protein